MPFKQMAQVRSDDTVGATFWYAPAGHGELTAVHGLPSSTLENVSVPSHAPHTRLVVSVPAVTCPWPSGQVRHATQASLPAVALNMPDAHEAHWRSEDALGAMVSYSPAWQMYTE